MTDVWQDLIDDLQKASSDADARQMLPELGPVVERHKAAILDPLKVCPCGGTCHHSAKPCSFECIVGEG